MKHAELCGDMPLMVIYNHEGAASSRVIRWCPNCGAVVVDEDIDGVTKKGAYTKMMFPKLAGAKIAQMLAIGEMVPRDLSTIDQETILNRVRMATQDNEAIPQGDGDAGDGEDEG